MDRIIIPFFFRKSNVATKTFHITSFRAALIYSVTSKIIATLIVLLQWSAKI